MPAVDKIDLSARLIDPHAHTVKFDLWHTQNGAKAEMIDVIDADLSLIFLAVGNRGPKFVGSRGLLERAKRLLGQRPKFAGDRLDRSVNRVGQKHSRRISIIPDDIIVEVAAITGLAVIIVVTADENLT